MVGLFIYFLTAIKLLVMRNFGFAWTAFTFSGTINARALLDTVNQGGLPNSIYYILLGISVGLISVVSLIVSLLTIKPSWILKPGLSMKLKFIQVEWFNT